MMPWLHLSSIILTLYFTSAASTTINKTDKNERTPLKRKSPSKTPTDENNAKSPSLAKWMKALSSDKQTPPATNRRASLRSSANKSGVSGKISVGKIDGSTAKKTGNSAGSTTNSVGKSSGGTASSAGKISGGTSSSAGKNGDISIKKGGGSAVKKNEGNPRTREVRGSRTNKSGVNATSKGSELPIGDVLEGILETDANKDLKTSKEAKLSRARRRESSEDKTPSRRASLLDARRPSLLDAGLRSIEQMKGIKTMSAQDFKDPPSSPITPAVLQSKENIAVERNWRLNHLSLKDRSIAELLMKYCECWTEETRHDPCLESYEEFLVTINNRYHQELELSVVTSALKVLSSDKVTCNNHNNKSNSNDSINKSNSSSNNNNNDNNNNSIETNSIDNKNPSSVILRTALFTSELLKVLTHNNQHF